MDKTDTAMKTTLRIPGNWSHPGELIERMPPDFRLMPETLILPDGVEIEFAPEALNNGRPQHMMCSIPGGIRVEFIAPEG